jgi:hypothetical protein
MNAMTARAESMNKRMVGLQLMLTGANTLVAVVLNHVDARPEALRSLQGARSLQG